MKLDPMNILSFDTSNSFASVAILANGNLAAYNKTSIASQQAEKLFSLIISSLNKAQLKLNDIDLITVCNGPGSFTGVRIAMAAISGIELGYKGKIIALSGFQVLAWKAKNIDEKKDIIVVLDGRNEQLYIQFFDSNANAKSKPKLISVTELGEVDQEKHLIIGDGVKFLPNNNQIFNFSVDAELLALASEYYAAQNIEFPLEPLYIRPPYVS